MEVGKRIEHIETMEEYYTGGTRIVLPVCYDKDYAFRLDTRLHYTPKRLRVITSSTSKEEKIIHNSNSVLVKQIKLCVMTV